MSEIVRVLLIDANPTLRVGLRHALEEAPGIAVVGKAEGRQDALDQMNNLQPDVVVLDCGLLEEEKMAIAAAARQPDYQAMVLALVSPGEEACVKDMIEAGAVGCLLKDESLDRIVEAVRAVARGAGWFSSGIAAQLPAWVSGARSKSQVGLTEREGQVLHLLADGKMNMCIAAELGITERTVRFHLRNIYDKLGVHSRTEAAVWAVRNQMAGKE